MTGGPALAAARNLPVDLWKSALEGAAAYVSDVADCSHEQVLLAFALEQLRRDGYLRTEPGGRPGERVDDGGVMGTLVRCAMCGGSGLLHKPDHMPETAAPQPEPPSPAQSVYDKVRGWLSHALDMHVDLTEEQARVVLAVYRDEFEGLLCHARRAAPAERSTSSAFLEAVQRLVVARPCPACEAARGQSCRIAEGSAGAVHVARVIGRPVEA